MKQKEIVDSLPLLDSQGQLNEEGWARYPHWTYDRRAIKASWLRVKEWDYYYVLSDDLKKGITFTISDLGYAGLIAICWLDFDTGEFRQVDTIAPLTRGKLFDEYGREIGYLRNNICFTSINYPMIIIAKKKNKFESYWI